ncbi:MAG: hypothetical protein ACLR6B_20150 [Blautia sp.]
MTWTRQRFARCIGDLIKAGSRHCGRLLRHYPEYIRAVHEQILGR